LVSFVSSKIPQLLSFEQEIPHVAPASQIVLEASLSELESIESVLRKLNDDMVICGNEKENDENDPYFKELSVSINTMDSHIFGQ